MTGRLVSSVPVKFSLHAELSLFPLATMTACEGAVFCLLLLLTLGQAPHYATAGKILVWPGEFSHWLNIKVIIEELIARGHTVTIVTHSATPSVKTTQSPGYNVDIIQVPHTKQEITDHMESFIKYMTNDLQHDNIIQAALKIKGIVEIAAEQNQAFCRNLFAREDLLNKWSQEQFELLLTDPMNMCGELLAQKLNLPFIISLRFSFGNVMERLCGELPMPPSYVPGITIGYTDQMDFLQRVVNILFNLFQDLLFISVTAIKWDSLYTEVLGKPTTLCDTMGKADIWLIRTYWDFEYPRPFLPNFKFVGGLHCKPAKPLPKEMEEFVQSSGDDGIVVFSLGSMVKNLTKERANTIAAALGQIPQKVLWRYTGEKPDTLAPNTRLYDWIPQNDLLGHPKTKAFITHGGTNGLYEAIYHGVPMVGIPLFADQPDNLLHMKTKGAAVMLEYNKMQTKDLKDALTEVINNPSYKESMMRLSRIHHDQPMKPLDQAVFWIEFVMRNKGAKHLRVAAHDLTWYQYYCLDVAAFLLSIVALVTFIFVKSCAWLFRKCCRRTSAKSKKE
ncbi:UDP-glucuronosyltransferase 2C1-like isoform X1 [Pygocentrus nattereri]|uniref:UDP-glucuronosyltransferase 2C1-like isoform X1 n=2 Tax=Pygocentrus nattereri TaxID=42514 RepID=UPI0008142982|nr:UDP-glucuronosyltransferase 2C1-like isoform X1 [Pygocentrus nattereri]